MTSISKSWNKTNSASRRPIHPVFKSPVTPFDHFSLIACSLEPDKLPLKARLSKIILAQISNQLAKQQAFTVKTTMLYLILHHQCDYFADPARPVKLCGFVKYE
jgi:hypothetical protein